MKQLTAMLIMLLFLCTAGSIKAGDTNSLDNNSITPEKITLTEQELNEANDLVIASNTLFSFFLPKNEHVIISIFDVNGAELTVLFDDNRAGEFSVELKKANLIKGIYYYKLIVGKYKEVRKLVITK